MVYTDRQPLTPLNLLAPCCKLIAAVMRDTCRFRVLIGNNGAMHFGAYPEPYNDGEPVNSSHGQLVTP